MFLLDKIIYCYESITPFQAAMAISFIFLYVLYLFLRDMDVPPGPKGLPLFGYWPFLKTDTCHVQLQQLSKKYGDVFSLRVAGTLFIHLGSIKAIREAHITKSECFAGRFTGDNILVFLFRDGVAFVNGEPWKVLRKFFLSKFREYGMNTVKENAVTSICDAMKETIEELHNSKGHPIQIVDVITMKCLNIIRRILFHDEGITNEELKELNDQYNEITKAMTSKNLLLIGNFAKYCMFPFMPSIRKLKRCNKRIETILFEIINRRKSEYNESQIVDLMDCYFKERDDRRRKGDPTAVHFTDKALVSSVSQFVTDGGLTVGVFIGMFFLTLVERPEEQEKIYEEILEVIGTDRLPSIEDKTNLPYTSAFIYEVVRFNEMFPMSPSLECTKDTTLQGYKIPAGSITLLNVYAAHRNPSDFENPDEFNPSRYLPSADKQRPDLPVLFGIGKRACIGEAFSMIQTFLFLTTIVQNFRLSYPEGSQKLADQYWLEERSEICAHPRSHSKTI